jgi:hypothetical protein
VAHRRSRAEGDVRQVEAIGRGKTGAGLDGERAAGQHRDSPRLLAGLDVQASAAADGHGGYSRVHRPDAAVSDGARKS